ncbi:iron complex outermembrane recepter protein [Methylomagnum ishizawai]|uniref:Iron complex outermembrane recepter protein n=1 Tax=Methylomagnum ishizawai TaxID=1760988 RepID=A0A1Y6D3Q2_9GAMM|nr:TonB-dependent siderophore receptor [Methylomagnum ishizawai]SMF97568.1 iron complex outermembrane recepter protein [Methylomagnum ishizawai]
MQDKIIRKNAFPGLACNGYLVGILASAAAVADTTAQGSGTAVVLDPVTVTGESEDARRNQIVEQETRRYYVPDATSATKTDTPIMDTPAAIQVVPQAVLRDQQAWRVEDAVKNVSGVQQVWQAGGQQQDFVIRGFGTQYARFRNGVRLSTLTFDMANVEQVEVLKGPASMLYGRIQPGGLVNTVTRKPLDIPFYSIQQQFGSYDFYRTTLDATGPITQDGSLAYRFDFGYTDRNSFRDFVSQDQKFVAPTLRWRASPDTEFNLSVEYLDRTLPYDTGLPAVGKRVANVPISNNYGQPGSKFNSDPVNSGLVDFNWSHSFNADWKLQNGVVANWQDTQYREILVAVFQPKLETTSNPQQVRRGVQFEDQNQDTYTTYFNLNGKFETWGLKHTLLVGGDYFSQKTNQSGFFGLSALLDPVNPVDYFTYVNLNNPQYPNLSYQFFDNLRKNSPNDFNTQMTSWYGLYFQDQIALLDNKVQIMGGGRYDWARQYQGTSSESFDDIVHNHQSEGHFSPRVGLLYRPWSWLSLYGNYVEGFGVNNGRSADNQPLAPETAEQFEAGLKTETLDGRLMASMAYFHIDKTNVLALVGENVFSTIGAARSQGIEFDSTGRLTDELSLTASYAYTDARITHDGEGTNQGNRLPNVPEHSGSVWLKYAFSDPVLHGLSLGVGSYISGPRQGDNENSYTLPGYVRADTYAAYTLPVGPTRLTAQLNVNNVFDKRYFYAGQPYNASRAWNAPADPLTVLGSLRLEY